MALPMTLVGRNPHGYYGLSVPVPALVIVPVPALLMSQVLCGGRCPLDPLARRTGFGTSQIGCKAALAPALP